MPEGIAQRFLTVHFWKSLGAGSLKAVLSVDQWSRYDCGEIRRPISKYKSPFCLHRAVHIEQRGDLGTKRSQYHMEMFSCCAQPVIRLALDYSPDLEFSLMSNSGCVCTCQITQNSFRPCFVFGFFSVHTEQHSVELFVPLTVWLRCTPEQLWPFAVDPSGQRGDTETQYLLTALSSRDTTTFTSDNSLWRAERGRKSFKKPYGQHLD